MDREEFTRVIEAVKVLPLRPEDRVLVRTQLWLTAEQKVSLCDRLRAAFGDRVVVVLEGGIDVEIVRPDA